MRIRSLMTAIGMTLGLLVATPVASATAQSVAAPPACGTVNPSSATSVTTVRSLSYTTSYSILVELRSGYIGGLQYGWTRVTRTDGNLPSATTLDPLMGILGRSTNCGGVAFTTSNSRVGFATRTSSDPAVQFRACAYSGSVNCTTWW